jgi:hypothetical protein
MLEQDDIPEEFIEMAEESFRFACEHAEDAESAE